MSGFAILLIVVLAFCAYFLPWIVAKSRDHHNSLPIGLLNLFLGWTLIGWLGALIWATTSPAPRS